MRGMQGVLFERFLQGGLLKKEGGHLREASPKVKMAFHLAALISIAIEHAVVPDLLFVTIILREDEDAGMVLRNLRKHVKRETGTTISWAGTHVKRSTEVKNDHLHVIMAGALYQGKDWDALNSYMDGRNKLLPRSCNMKLVFDLLGLFHYITNRDNLLHPGADIFKSNSLVPTARDLYSKGPATLEAQVKQLVRLLP